MLKRNICFVLFAVCLFITSAYANFDMNQNRNIDELLTKRLNLTVEQREIIRKNHIAFKNNLDVIFSQMRKEHYFIKSVYDNSDNKIYCDFKTSASKAKLWALKQKAEKLRDENRVNFEAVLTPAQKQEFDKIKSEIKLYKEQNKSLKN